MNQNEQSYMSLKQYIKEHKEEFQSVSMGERQKETNPRFRNLSVTIDQFLKMYPKEISIFQGQNTDNFSVHREEACKNSELKEQSILRQGKTQTLPLEKIRHYRFLFSEDGTNRQTGLSKKKIPNTKVLYDRIFEEFFNNGILVSLQLREKKLQKKYFGICLENDREQKLNLYFPEDESEEFGKNLAALKIQKQKEFLRYAEKLIERDEIDNFVVRPTVDNRSSIIYISNREEYSSYLLKKRQLGYYYRREEGKIEEEDLFAISEIIRYFINCHLKENPQYIYKTNPKYQTESLQIVFDSGRIIQLTDNETIDNLEKLELIDDLYRLKQKKISRMPTTPEKTLKKGVK